MEVNEGPNQKHDERIWSSDIGIMERCCRLCNAVTIQGPWLRTLWCSQRLVTMAVAMWRRQRPGTVAADHVPLLCWSDTS